MEINMELIKKRYGAISNLHVKLFALELNGVSIRTPWHLSYGGEEVQVT